MSWQDLKYKFKITHVVCTLIFVTTTLTLASIFTPNFQKITDLTNGRLDIDSNIESIRKQISQSFNPDSLRLTLAKLYLRKAKATKNRLELYKYSGSALAELKKVLESNPSFELNMKIAEIQIELGFSKRAIPHLSLALELRPDDERAQLLLGEVLFQSKKYTRAKEKLENYLKNSKNKDGKAYLRLAQIDFFKNDYKMALAKVQLALKKNPSEFEANFLLGEIHQKLNNLESATLSYEKATTDSKNSLPAFLKLGEIYNYTQNYEKAEDNYQKALAISPETTIAHDGIGFASLGLGKFEDAESAFKRAVTLDTKKASSFYGLGICEAHMENFALAVDYLSTAFSLDKDYRDYATKDKYLEVLWNDEKFKLAIEKAK